LSKYDIDLDLQTKNSLSAIIERIKSGSKILEFGPSHGRLTRFLNEYMACEVSCVELDEEAAQEASRYAHKMIVGDIESLAWEEEIGDEKFDYILFADVLEHLQNPAKILQIVQKYLKESGSIIISIPNVAHGAILIDLLQDKFIYRDVGLLDNTHIKLFTKSTLDAMIKECGLYKSFETSIVKEPEATEFANSYNELPLSVASYVQNKPHSSSYQFIMELKTQPSESLVSAFEFDSEEQGRDEEKFIEYKEHTKITSSLKAIAFYLPQFHPFEENDAWWGKGFTEWTNVTKAKPNFQGHYQPHLPIHNGFYDLRIPQVMQEQAKLAKNYGIYGFNFYYYWFGGKVLMHRPFDILLEHKEIDINFCITWANENWTRTWDASENEILIAQRHSDEDSRAFIQNMFQYFQDPRYIRVDNKPVLIIYRCDIIPNIVETTSLWREEAAQAGFEGIHLVCAQTYGIKDPAPYGFDAAIEFPPHNALSMENKIHKTMLNQEFTGSIFDYAKTVEEQCMKERPSYKCYETLMLSWDNTARKQNHSNIFSNFSLDAYKDWLSNIATHTFHNQNIVNEERFIFINAWNEWAEGTHLEPDRKYGYGYLEATYDTLRNYDAEIISSIGKTFTQCNCENAVVLHVYDADTQEDLETVLARYTHESFDLYLTASTLESKVLSNLRIKYPQAQIILTQKRGGDVFGFFEVYKKIRFLDYQNIWRIHAKKKPMQKNFNTDFELESLLDIFILDFRWDNQTLQKVSIYLDQKFSHPSDEVLQNKQDERTMSSSKKVTSIMEQITNNNQIYVPKSNNIALSNKISLMLKKIADIKEKQQKVFVYGHGYLGKMAAIYLGDALVGVVDKNPPLEHKEAYTIISLNELKNYEYDSVVVTVIGREIDIIKSLTEHNVDVRKILIL
jgi:lipopolysaccharide biosynthesis protein/2-polyprenyl-3-methyl-5-hydroxy-6-metoxy-1,4-benzoquinol methylase